MERVMKYILDEIRSLDRKIRVMEVCGTHTHAIYKNGINGLINGKIELISGPGCPVCVTDEGDIDYAYELSKDGDNIIVTYGDMIRVQGSKRERSLEMARKEGAHIKIVYSPLEALEIAKKKREKRVIFLGVGFETTIPGTCRVIRLAEEMKVQNFKVLSMHKSIKPPMELILEDPCIDIQGFLIPGHVASIIGVEGFKFLEREGKSSCITGFKGEEILFGLYKIVNSIKNEKWEIVNGYKSAVRSRGNEMAMRDYIKMFQLEDVKWRGLGMINKSGFKLKESWAQFDIEREAIRKESLVCEINRCKCGDVLKGIIKPNECIEFGKRCTPLNPIGPCMVSSEGSCAAFYKYNRGGEL